MATNRSREKTQILPKNQKNLTKTGQKTDSLAHRDPLGPEMSPQSPKKLSKAEKWALQGFAPSWQPLLSDRSTRLPFTASHNTEASREQAVVVMPENSTEKADNSLFRNKAILKVFSKNKPNPETSVDVGEGVEVSGGQEGSEMAGYHFRRSYQKKRESEVFEPENEMEGLLRVSEGQRRQRASLVKVRSAGFEQKTKNFNILVKGLEGLKMPYKPQKRVLASTERRRKPSTRSKNPFLIKKRPKRSKAKTQKKATKTQKNRIKRTSTHTTHTVYPQSPLLSPRITLKKSKSSNTLNPLPPQKTAQKPIQYFLDLQKIEQDNKEVLAGLLSLQNHKKTLLGQKTTILKIDEKALTGEPSTPFTVNWHIQSGTLTSFNQRKRLYLDEKPEKHDFFVDPKLIARRRNDRLNNMNLPADDRASVGHPFREALVKNDGFFRKEKLRASRLGKEALWRFRRRRGVGEGRTMPGRAVFGGGSERGRGFLGLSKLPTRVEKNGEGADFGDVLEV